MNREWGKNPKEENFMSKEKVEVIWEEDLPLEGLIGENQ